MNRHTKSLLRKVYFILKKILFSNNLSKRFTLYVVSGLKQLICENSKEVYDYYVYYPTITEYAKQLTSNFANTPLISILMPTYNTDEKYLRECIESIILQSYTNWELCIADDCSPNKNVVNIINEYQKKDPRIKLKKRLENGHISEATNSALEIATGDFVALMDHDDVLWPNALYEFVDVINNNPEVDFIYSDEDKIDSTSKIHSYPFLKPDFSPEFLESCNYITHFSCIRTSLVKKIGGFRKGVEGAQDWDLFIRISLLTKNIVHIPKILYSWRIHEGSTAKDTDAKPYVYEAQKKLLANYLKQKGTSGQIEKGIIKQHRVVKYDISKNTILSIQLEVKSVGSLERLLKSIKEYPPESRCTIEYYVRNKINKVEQLHNKYLGKSIEYKIVNKVWSFGDKTKASSKYILYMDSRTEILTNGWAKIILSEITRPGVVFVGPVILSSDNKKVILSAGVGVNYGTNRYLDMLEGCLFDDMHYTRGLYAMSRRNVTALSPHFFAYNNNRVNKIRSQSVIDTMIEAVNEHNRNIYTPYVAIATKKLGRYEISNKYSNYEDRLLNPNFNPDNQLMEVKK